MTPKLVKKIKNASPLRLEDLRPGDKVQGFEAWGCVPDNATRTVCGDDKGMFVHCAEGRHYLDGQTDDPSGVLLGMCRA